LREIGKRFPNLLLIVLVVSNLVPIILLYYPIVAIEEIFDDLNKSDLYQNLKNIRVFFDELFPLIMIII